MLSPDGTSSVIDLQARLPAKRLRPLETFNDRSECFLDTLVLFVVVTLKVGASWQWRHFIFTSEAIIIFVSPFELPFEVDNTIARVFLPSNIDNCNAIMVATLTKIVIEIQIMDSSLVPTRNIERRSQNKTCEER